MNLPPLLLAFLCVCNRSASSFALQARRKDSLADLNSSDGETPCTMMSKSATPCLGDDDPSFPTPSSCTCNNVFFNLWSACVLSTGNDTLPRYDDWGIQCEDSSLVLKDGYPIQFRESLDLPGWAFMNVPSTSQFDVGGAMQMANPTQGWTKTQVMLPIMVGAVALGLLVFLLYRSSSKKVVLGSFKNVHLLHRRPRVHKVRTAERSSTWSIDPSEELGHFVMVDHDETRSHRGHHRLPSSETIVPLNGDAAAETEYHVPGKRAWKHSPFSQHLRRLSIHASSFFQWRVQDVQPSNAFRIDAFDGITPLRTSDLSAGRYTRPVTEPGIANHEDEGISLISQEERDENRVLLISRYPNVDFTLESGSSNSHDRDYHQIDVIPATPTSEASDPFPPPEPITPPRDRPLIIPPVPKTPPPSPPPPTPPPSTPLPSPPSQSSLSRSSRQTTPTPAVQSSPRHTPDRELVKRPPSSAQRCPPPSTPNGTQPLSPPLTPPPSIPLPPLPHTPSRLQPLPNTSSAQAASGEMHSALAGPSRPRSPSSHEPQPRKGPLAQQRDEPLPPTSPLPRGRLPHLVTNTTDQRSRSSLRPKGARPPTPTTTSSSSASSRPKRMVMSEEDLSACQWELRPCLLSPDTTESQTTFSPIHYRDPFSRSIIPHGDGSGARDGVSSSIPIPKGRPHRFAQDTSSS